MLPEYEPILMLAKEIQQDLGDIPLSPRWYSLDNAFRFAKDPIVNAFMFIFMTFVWKHNMNFNGVCILPPGRYCNVIWKVVICFQVAHFSSQVMRYIILPKKRRNDLWHHCYFNRCGMIVESYEFCYGFHLWCWRGLFRLQ